MNVRYVFIIGILGIIPFITFDSAFAQVEINVTDAGQPCFLNYTAGLDMWENCGADEDYLAFTLLPFEWVTGGLFSMVIASVIILMVWVKYQNMIYPLAIGIVLMPTSYYLFPESFVSFALLLTAIAVAIGIYYGLMRQTKEY